MEARRKLHKNPELTGQEFETSKFLKEEMKKLETEIIEVQGEGNTGFIAIMDTGREGKKVGFRADIDALPVDENEYNLSNKRVTASKNEGVMHACGHDGHMAITLTLAKIIYELKDKLSGKIYFIFEEGEELGTGISGMIEELKNHNLDAIYGKHLSILLETGKIAANLGPVMAGSYTIDFDVIGKGGHGSRPDLSISPIFAAANIITGLGSAWVNQVDVTKTVTLGLGKLQAGKVVNVIPDKANIGGTLRYFDIEEGERAAEILKNVSDHTAQAHNCTIDWTNTGPGANPVINDVEVAKIVRQGIEDIMPGALAEDIIWFASESFNRYSEVAPSVFTLVGTRNDDLGSGAEHHNEYFDLDEDSLYYGILAALKFAVNFLDS